MVKGGVKSFAGFDFVLIGPIEPERGPGGAVREFMPQGRYAQADSTRLNPNGAGPFCKFSIARGIDKPGVYVVTLGTDPVYAGMCVDLAKRWGQLGYGAISPKNCFVGGQSTNCKVNNRVLECSKAGGCLKLWFHQTTVAASAERTVIRAFKPAWNARVPG